MERDKCGLNIRFLSRMDADQGKKQEDKWSRPLRKRRSKGIGSLFSSLLTVAGKGKTARKFPDPPILVVGSPRSGTSITITVLSAHPALYCLPYESRMLTEWEELADGSIYPQRMYRLHRHVLFNAIPNGKKLVEKTPTHLIEVPEIEKFYGEGKTKYIHVLRDGRDVVLSKYPRTDVSPKADRWLYEVNLARKFAALPNFYTLKYESLILDFENSMIRLCEFLEIDFTEEMQHWFQNKSIDKHIGYGEAKPLFADSVGKWKKHREHEEVRFLNEDKSARESLAYWGYELD